MVSLKAFIGLWLVVRGSRLAHHSDGKGHDPTASQWQGDQELRAWAQETFNGTGIARNSFKTGGVSLFEKVFMYFTESHPDTWKTDWLFSQGFSVEGDEGATFGWQQMVLPSIIMPKGKHRNGLECLKFGRCSWFDSMETPQHLLEESPSGGLVPILSFERGDEDRSWAQKKSHDYKAFVKGQGLEYLEALQRFNFLGRWMARAYILTDLGYAPASFHPLIYESLVAGHAVTPARMPNGYQDEDTIQECEWLAAIYSSRGHKEIKTYGWQSCNETKDPDSGRYIQETCYKPVYRSRKTWNVLAVRWGAVAPQGVRTDAPVPFEQAREYTMRKCASKWQQDFEAPVAALVHGFRDVIDPGFWEKLEGPNPATRLQRLIEGDQEINVERFMKEQDFKGKWTEDQLTAVKDMLKYLSKSKGMPPFRGTLNNLLFLQTGIFTEFVGGYTHAMKRFAPIAKFLKLPEKPSWLLTLGGTCSLTARQFPQFEISITTACVADTSTLTNIIEEKAAACHTLLQPATSKALHREELWELKAIAREMFPFDRQSSGFFMKLDRKGKTSVFEQTRVFMREQIGWYEDWDQTSCQVKFNGEDGIDAGGLKKEWLQLVLQSVVIPGKDPGEGLQCLKSGQCSNTESPQYLLEELPSGELIPIMSFQRDDAPWSHWMSTSFGSFAEGAWKQLPFLARFKLLGEWLARAHVVSNQGYAPASLHMVVYESIVAGHVVKPLPVANGYEDEDIIPECEWLAAIYGSRRPQNLETYGWTSCDEVIDPQSGRYTQDSCFKPLYRSAEMWEYLYAEWGPVAPEGVKPEDLVPFDQARNYTTLKCMSKWYQGFEAPVNKLVRGFRTIIVDEDFWYHLADAATLKLLIEGDPEVNLTNMIEAIQWKAATGMWWTKLAKQVVKDTLYNLGTKNQGIPPFQNTLNRLLHFFTGSYKATVGGFQPLSLTFEIVDNPRCAPLVGKTCFNLLKIPAGCLKNTTVLENIILESVATEGFGLA